MLSSVDTLKERFTDEQPLPGLLVVNRLLDEVSAGMLRAACSQGDYATYCVFTKEEEPGKFQSRFTEPEEGATYVTIHHRARGPSPQLLAVRDRLASPEVIQFLNRMTGLSLSRLGQPDVLTLWEAWSFIEPHTDMGTSGEPPKLVISLSLTEGWKPEYGGRTTFAWSNAQRSITLEPRFNQAVIFAPFEGSVHWVEQLTEAAPPRTRFTWTLHYL